MTSTVPTTPTPISSGVIPTTPVDTRFWPSTLIGPLTTIFTPPSSCISDVYLPTSINEVGPWYWLNLGPTSTEVCLPSGWGPSAYYSPAQCPSGYSANIVSTVGPETQAVCCPSIGQSTYTLRPQTSPTPSWYPTELCQSQPFSGTTTFPLTTYVGAGSSSIVSASVDANGLINAYGISIRWKEGDFPASASATPTATQSPNPAAGDGLSSGAKAGVGVGVTLAGLLVIGLVAFFFFRRKRQGQGTRVLSSEGQQYMGDAGYVPHNSYRAHELDAGYSDAGLSNDKFKSKPVELDAGYGDTGLSNDRFKSQPVELDTR